jgi:hypothetical protein
MSDERRVDPMAARDVWNPQYQWIHKLTRRHRREVARHARRGARHPEPLVARIAEAWARAVLEPPARKERTGNAVVSVLLAFVSEEALGTWIGMGIAQRRLAKRILKAASAES